MVKGWLSFAPPGSVLSSSRCRRASLTHRLAVLVEAVDVRCLGRDEDPLAGLGGELAGYAHGHVTGPGDSDVEEGIAADVLGDRDSALPFALVESGGKV